MTDYYSYTKYNVNPSEFHIQDIIYNMNIVNIPKPYTYDPDLQTFTMRKIPEMSVSDMYGEKFSDVPDYITKQIRNIISTLYYHGIEYPDITGYNFIEYQNKIWIIDFEHASFNSKPDTYDPFILEFINGRNEWNPNYT
jgi:tRNA A-37 threonylcarbamoyl transferase component Bud32